MNPGALVSDSYNLTLPSEPSIVGCNMKLPISPPSESADFGRIAQQPTLFNLPSTHTIVHSQFTTHDGLSTTPAENGAEELPDRQEPMATVMHIRKKRHTRTSKDVPNVTHRLITPPLSSASPSACQTSRRGPVTRKRAATRKRNLRAKLANEDLMMIKTLPNELRTFLEKEMLWSNAQADSDYMLRLPSPNHKYVDARKRLMLDDLRFTSPIVEKGGQNFLSAGIPSEKRYAPYYEAASSPVQLTTLSSGVNETANDPSQEEAFHARPSIKLIIPDAIKALLVDDWENVTKNMQLVPLPHPKPVTKILEDYSEYEMPKRVAGSSHADILEETLSGLKEYFDKSLGRILLYK